MCLIEVASLEGYVSSDRFHAWVLAVLGSWVVIWRFLDLSGFGGLKHRGGLVDLNFARGLAGRYLEFWRNLVILMIVMILGYWGVGDTGCIDILRTLRGI